MHHASQEWWKKHSHGFFKALGSKQHIQKKQKEGNNINNIISI